MRQRILILLSVLLLSGLAFGQAVPVADQGSLRGRLTDTSNGGVAGATVILSQPGGQTVGITTTNSGGEYVFRTMASGDYTVQAFAVGFGPSRLVNVNLPGGRAVTQDISMDLRFANAAAGTVTGDAKPAGLREDGRLRIGGTVAAANLLQQTKPIRPPLAVDAKITGIVILDIVIGTDGAVKEMRTLSGHPYLQQAAIDTVARWRYKPILLNGVPTEVLTTVTVNFTAD